MIRDSEAQAAGLHPLVRGYLASGEPSYVLARQMPEPRAPVVQTMVLLGECQLERRRYEEAAEAVQKLDLSDCDPSLHIILLDLWATLANENGRYGEVQALAKRARALVSRHIPPEIQSLVRAMESYRVIVGGDLAKRAAGLKESLDLMPRTSPRRFVVLLNYVWSFATQGRLAEVGPELAEMHDHPESSSMGRVIELVNRVETGQADGALSIIAELGPPWQPHWASGRMARQRSAYRTVRAIVAMMKGDSSLERVYRELGLGDPQDSEYLGPEVTPEKLPTWVLALHHLLERRPAQALQHARAHAAEWGEAMDRETGIVSLNLVRSELACGHAEAARRLLDRRQGIGNVHYLDDLFLARLELLTGEREAAARHFSVALTSADRYGAHGRVDFELRMACELSPGDIAWLARAAGALPAARSGGLGGSAGRAHPASGPQQLVGTSPALAQIRKAIEQLAPLDVPVLVIGETGTGKELVARLLHEQSPRRAGPFLAVNCGAIAETLLESELFGHEKGAFTGAERPRKGLFEEAAGGTVLLDEIGEISPRLQVMLLRVLETGEIRPVGGSRGRRIACRILAATNADLQDLADNKLFRRDLYYRLKRMEIRLAPLRERPGDILPLAGHFLSEGRQDGQRPALSARLRQWLLEQTWPGNVRELRNFIERLRLLNSEKLEYDLADVPGGAEAEAGKASAQPPPAAASAPQAAMNAPASLPPGPGAAAAGDESAFLAQGRSPLRRRDRLRALFARHGKLTRQELSTLLGISPDTASRDLKLLLAEGLVEKVEPTASPRTHYFRVRSS